MIDQNSIVFVSSSFDVSLATNLLGDELVTYQHSELNGEHEVAFAKN